MLSAEFVNASRLGNAYIWTCEPHTCAIGETVLLVRNDHQTLNLHIEKIVLHTAKVVEVEIHVPTVAFTITGTAVVGECLNRDEDNVASATAKSIETGNTQGDVIERVMLEPDTQPYVVDLSGALTLDYNQSVGVDYDTDCGGSQVAIWGYFKK